MIKFYKVNRNSKKSLQWKDILTHCSNICLCIKDIARIFMISTKNAAAFFANSPKIINLFNFTNLFFLLFHKIHWCFFTAIKK